MYKLGIDVGGTNTDAIIIDDNDTIISEIKYPTSKDVYRGIKGAIKTVLKNSGISAVDIEKAMLGTTQCTNAIVERKNLTPVGVLRIGAPATCGIEPMTDWKPDIRKICSDYAIIKGGFEYNGRKLATFDTEAAVNFFNNVKGKVCSIAIIGVFSNVRNDQELQAATLCRKILGNKIHISLSHEIGSMGLIERENATILNAALFDVAQRFTDGFDRSLKEEGIINAEVYLSQNDGTLMTIEKARQFPILTIACGPTNSIRGAGYLTNLKNAIVIDIGGTTSDLGVIQNGFPRESSTAVTIGSIRTNFRMPDVLSIGLGGGSIVRQKGNGTVTVGPDSVGYEINSKAMVFGGNTITATDIAVRLGMACIGNYKLTASIDLSFAKKALEVISEMIEKSIDLMKVSNKATDVILVGGGSIIIPDSLQGVSTVIKPEHFSVANAIGSAISKVSGTYEYLADYNKTPRTQAIIYAKEKAIQNAINAGAAKNSIEIIETEEVPLAYHPGNTNRIKIKAAGNLR